SREIVHELTRSTRVACTDHPRSNQLGIGTQRGPRPDVTNTEDAFQVLRDILFLRADERPDFIALHPLAWQVAQRLVLIVVAGFAYISEQLRNRVFARPCQS